MSQGKVKLGYWVPTDTRDAFNEVARSRGRVPTHEIALLMEAYADGQIELEETRSVAVSTPQFLDAPASD